MRHSRAPPRPIGPSTRFESDILGAKPASVSKDGGPSSATCLLSRMAAWLSRSSRANTSLRSRNGRSRKSSPRARSGQAASRRHSSPKCDKRKMSVPLPSEFARECRSPSPLRLKPSPVSSCQEAAAASKYRTDIFSIALGNLCSFVGLATYCGGPMGVLPPEPSPSHRAPFSKIR
jgi:hypothetical protein